MARASPPPVVTGAKAPPARAPLFRDEVLAEQQTQWLGTVLLAPKISHALFAAFAALVTAAILGLLFFADYTRKERISGWLVPQQGVVRIFTPQPGVITQLNVENGAEVQKGAPLLVLSTELESEALGATQGEIVRRLASRRDSLAADRDLQREATQQRQQGLTRRLAALRSEQEYLESERDLQQSRVALAEASKERLRPLYDQGLLTAQRWQQEEDNRLDHASKLQALEREWAQTERERLLLVAEVEALPLESRARLAEIDRNIAALEQELAQAEARRQIVISAPQDGIVTAVQVELGSSVNTSVPLLNILPAGSELEAELFLPSRAIGFVRPGQPVLLRYQAFPYQKFGHYQGRVANVARSAIAPGELPQRLSSLTSLHGAQEPIYPVIVSLERQTANAYGEAVPLHPGMRLEADVLIEHRRLYEWILDPLFTLTGKWHG